jgi:hypothetical protein
MIIIEIFERGGAQQYSLDQPRGPRFAHDSLLEGGGFEPSVPRKEEMLLRVPDAPHAAGRAVTADPCERQQVAPNAGIC